MFVIRYLYQSLNIEGKLLFLSPRNTLRWGYSNAAVVPSVRPSVCGSVRPCEDLVNTIETKPLHISLSNLADMLTMMRG